MDFNAIVQGISMVGFPIVMCLILMWYINKNAVLHKEEIDKMSDALKNNTIALVKLSEKLDNIKSEEKKDA